MLHISCNGQDTRLGHLNIYNALGQMIISEKVSGYSTEVDLSTFEQGLYSVSVEMENGATETRRIIIAR